MWDKPSPCVRCKPKPLAKRPLTMLMLDCWQREYDKRPYANFRFQRLEFEKRMGRGFFLVKDFETVIRFIQERPLQSIYLSGVRVVECQSSLAADFAESLPKLQRIELKVMNLPTNFFELLRDNVQHMKVQELSFEGTPLNNADVEALHIFLVNSQTLRYINVSNCEINQYNFALLADGIQKSSSIRGFNASRLLGKLLTLDTEKMAHILSSLIWQNKLVEIEMQHCEFLAQDIEVIAEYLANRNCKLRKLIFACNIIGPDGAESLFRAIIKGDSLTHLDISRNSLGTHGGEIVAKYLSSSYLLEYINLSHNAIGANAMNLILTTLKKRISLQKMKFYGNRFNGKSARVLRRLLDSYVVKQDSIDITVTFDSNSSEYCVIPYIS